jgi:uroporphyrinogen-III synthase
MRLLVTRPKDDAARTARALEARGHQVLLAPLMRIEPVGADLRGPWAAALITSANAARALREHRRREDILGLPVFAVGERSAEAARAAGFADVVSADGALADLARLVAARRAGVGGAPLIYLAGEDRAGDLAAELEVHGIDVRTVAVYRARVADALPDDAARALGVGAIDGVLHYSRRSAETFLRLADKAGLLNAAVGLGHYCLSAEVAVPLAENGAARVEVAAAPNETALLRLVGSI